ncbi:MAG: hypothetical protein JSW33_09360 [bacterium]|nr:MAG: hypothetical protein JSW33_09360 [bacterium]
MMTKSNLKSLLILGIGIFFIFPQFILAAALEDSTKQERQPGDTTFVFSNVNIKMETSWSDPEIIENVTVQLRCIKNDPYAICYQDVKGDKNEIRLIPGMVATIISRESGKVLKTIVKPEIKQEPPQKQQKK